MDNVCSCAFGLYKDLKARCGPLVHQSAFSGHLKSYKPKDWLAYLAGNQRNHKQISVQHSLWN